MYVLGREGWEGVKVGIREGIAEPKVMSTHSSIFSLSEIFWGMVFKGHACPHNQGPCFVLVCYLLLLGEDEAVVSARHGQQHWSP